MIIYLLDYKQYGDRLARKFDTIAEYESGGYVLASWNDIQFNKNDGIVAKQILNTELDCSYLIVADDDNTILSRWYITDSNWIRKGQRQLTLYRDLLADFQDIVKSSTCKINRAMLEYNDPLIFNSEGINVNQIKTSETLLKDSTGVPWLVAYVDKGHNLTTEAYPDGYTIVHSRNGVEFTSYESLPLSDFIAQPTYGSPTNASIKQEPDYMFLNVYTNHIYPVQNPNNTIYKYTGRLREDGMTFASPSAFGDTWELVVDINGKRSVGKCDASTPNPPSDYLPIAPYDLYNTSEPSSPQDVLPVSIERDLFYGLLDELYTRKNFRYVSPDTKSFLEYLTRTSNQLYQYYDTDGNARYIKYQVVKTHRDYTYNTATDLPTTYHLVDDYLTTNDNRHTNMTQYPALVRNFPTVDLEADTYAITATEVRLTSEVSSASRYKKANGLYDMFCTPYADTTVRLAAGASYTITKDKALRFYQSIAEYNKDAVYDIQILPYCPDDNYRKGYYPTSYSTTVFDSTTIPIINIQKDEFTFDIAFSDPMTTNNKTRKQRIITDFYRLCDPGYNGIFEFNSEKNNGISKFNVDMTLKPFNPFIHLNPDFGGLYGQDFNDARGLICGSNFSISTISNRFAEYEMNNKNWQQMFNRQIQNLEFNQRYQFINAALSGLAGTLGTAVSSGGTAATMAQTMGPAGAVAGGIAGAVNTQLSMGAHLADLYILNKTQNEQRNYTKDMFGYQIDNIKALPDALTRVTTMNNIYKYFPFLEYYTCTDREKTTVNNYINWYSMTVNAIGTVNDYIKNSETFISATPLRTLLIGEDSHLDDVLAAEMEKGFFI